MISRANMASNIIGHWINGLITYKFNGQCEVNASYLQQPLTTCKLDIPQRSKKSNEGNSV